MTTTPNVPLRGEPSPFPPRRGVSGKRSPRLKESARGSCRPRRSRPGRRRRERPADAHGRGLVLRRHDHGMGRAAAARVQRTRVGIARWSRRRGYDADDHRVSGRGAVRRHLCPARRHQRIRHGAEWEREFFDHMMSSWAPFFDNLRLYLTHFPASTPPRCLLPWLCPERSARCMTPWWCARRE